MLFADFFIVIKQELGSFVATGMLVYFKAS